MNLKKSTFKPSNSQSVPHTRPASHQSESPVKSKASFLDQSSKMLSNKRNSVSRAENKNPLTAMIDEKVSNLKTKFVELNSLRQKLVDNRHECSDGSFSPVKPRVKSKEMLKVSKNKAILDGVMYKTEDNRKIISNIFEKKEAEIFSSKPDIDKLLFETESSLCRDEELNESERRSEMDELRMKLKIKEREVIESERVRKVQEKKLEDGERMYKELEEKYKVLMEWNNSLKVQVNRLENVNKGNDEMKNEKKERIKKLSYIILSKDKNCKELVDCREMDSDFLPRYVETLNELYRSDKLAVDVLHKLKKNQTKEALSALLDREDTVCSRLEQTQASIFELEPTFHSKSNHSAKSNNSAKSNHSAKSQSVLQNPKKLNINDLTSFLQCQASLVEELLTLS